MIIIFGSNRGLGRPLDRPHCGNRCRSPPKAQLPRAVVNPQTSRSRSPNGGETGRSKRQTIWKRFASWFHSAQLRPIVRDLSCPASPVMFITNSSPSNSRTNSPGIVPTDDIERRFALGMIHHSPTKSVFQPRGLRLLQESRQLRRIQTQILE